MVRTLVAFHAHPDDEAIATAGTMMKAKAAGHRVVLVVATKGELGEVPDDLGDGETLAERRIAETMDAARIVGVDRVEWLGYRDSGMEGEPSNDDEGTFHRADADEAAHRLAAILHDEQAHVLLTYDERGNYMHPDHVKVHHVGHRAAKLARTPVVYEATMNRDFVWNLMHEAREQREEMPNDLERAETIEEFNLGMREWTITHRVDVSEFVDRKRDAMAAHRSQIGETSFFLQMPPAVFAQSFGQEWFIRPGHPRPGRRAVPRRSLRTGRVAPASRLKGSRGRSPRNCRTATVAGSSHRRRGTPARRAGRRPPDPQGAAVRSANRARRDAREPRGRTARGHRVGPAGGRRRRRCGCFDRVDDLHELGQRIRYRLRECVEVGQQLAACEEPEVDRLEIADHRQVQARAVEDRAERVHGFEPRPARYSGNGGPGTFEMIAL